MGASTGHVPSSDPEAELPGGAPEEEVGGTGLELREEGRQDTQFGVLYKGFTQC